MKKRSNRTVEFGRGDGVVAEGLSGTLAGNHERAGSNDTIQRLKEQSEKLEKRSRKIHKRR